MVPIRINGQDYVTRAPAVKAEKLPSLGYESLDLGEGLKARINLTPERVQQIRAQASKLAAGEGEPDPFADVNAAEKQLKDLRVKNVKEFNVERGENGQLTVVEDGWFSDALTPAQVRKQIDDERKRIETIIKEDRSDGRLPAAPGRLPHAVGERCWIPSCFSDSRHRTSDIRTQRRRRPGATCWPGLRRAHC